MILPSEYITELISVCPEQGKSAIQRHQLA